MVDCLTTDIANLSVILEVLSKVDLRLSHSLSDMEELLFRIILLSHDLLCYLVSYLFDLGF